MDLFETLGDALRPEIKEKKSYFNVWIKVEAVTLDENGERVFTDMDNIPMPFKLFKLNSKEEVDKIMKQLEIY